MAIKTTRVCDVTGRSKDVRRICIRFHEFDDNTESWRSEPYKVIEVDLCPAAEERLERFMSRGLPSPN